MTISQSQITPETNITIKCNYNLSTECKNDFKAELHTVLQINKEIKSEGNETTKFGFIN